MRWPGKLDAVSFFVIFLGKPGWWVLVGFLCHKRCAKQPVWDVKMQGMNLKHRFWFGPKGSCAVEIGSVCLWFVVREHCSSDIFFFVLCLIFQYMSVLCFWTYIIVGGACHWCQNSTTQVDSQVRSQSCINNTVPAASTAEPMKFSAPPSAEIGCFSVWQNMAGMVCPWQMCGTCGWTAVDHMI